MTVSWNVLQVVRSMVTPRRLTRMPNAKLSMAEALQWLCRAEPTSKDLLEALQDWTAKTPARAALLQARNTMKFGQTVTGHAVFARLEEICFVSHMQANSL